MLVEKIAVHAVTIVASTGLEGLTLPDNWRLHIRFHMRLEPRMLVATSSP